MKKYYIVKFKLSYDEGLHLTITDIDPKEWETQTNNKIRDGRTELIAYHKKKAEWEAYEFGYKKFWFDGFMKSLKLFFLGVGRKHHSLYVAAKSAPIITIKVTNYTEITKKEYIKRKLYDPYAELIVGIGYVQIKT